MALQHKNYDPAVMAGASLDVTLDLAEILDPAGNEMLEFDQVSSAVNYIRIANAATTSPVTISAQGDDTNVGIAITPKGSGTVRFVMATSVTIDTGGTINLSALGRGDTHFVVTTTGFTPLTATGRTTLNTSWVAIQVVPTGAAATRRFIQIYD